MGSPKQNGGGTFFILLSSPNSDYFNNNAKKSCLGSVRCDAEIPLSPTTRWQLCATMKTLPHTEIQMSRYPFQDVYNHVGWICHPIKRERHYPRRFPGACWNTLTFRVSRRTEPTQSLQWSTSSGLPNTDHIFTGKQIKLHCSSDDLCLTVLIITHRVQKTPAEGRYFIYWFLPT